MSYRVSVFSFLLLRWYDNLLGRGPNSSSDFTGRLRNTFGKELSPSTWISDHVEAVHRCCVCSLRDKCSFSNMVWRDYTNYSVSSAFVCQLVLSNFLRPSPYHWP